MIILLFGTHIYLSIQLRFIQIRTLPLAIKMIFRKSDDDGDISPFSALMTALAATVGMGNIVGVATAIVLGGPGAVFWMWLTGFLGMATKYSEALLAVKYRQKGETGMQGGPMYYLTHGLGKRWLGYFFAIFTVSLLLVQVIWSKPMQRQLYLIVHLAYPMPGQVLFSLFLLR